MKTRRLVLALAFTMIGGMTTMAATPNMLDAEMGGAPQATANTPLVVPADSTVLPVDISRPFVSYISNVVYAQKPSRGYENVALKWMY